MIISFSTVNIALGIGMVYYFAKLGHDTRKTAEELANEEDEDCKRRKLISIESVGGQRNRFEVKLSNYFWSAIGHGFVILIAASSYLGAFFVLGFMTCFMGGQGEGYFGRSTVTVWEYYAPIAFISGCKIVELYVGHAWAVLRTKCLKGE